MATAPPRPNQPKLYNIRATVIDVEFSVTGNGGSPITARQIGYGTNPSGPTSTVPYSGGRQSVRGLTPGRTYYFWGRARNAIGWSMYSQSRSATTLRPPFAPKPPTFRNLGPLSVEVEFEDNGDGGQPINGRQIGYGTSSGTPQTTVSYSGRRTISGLNANTTYYFWSRTRNATGWSDWSSRRQITTLGGVWFRGTNGWGKATMYLRTATEWRVCKIYIYTTSGWRESK